jgi:hypothetical protein
MQGNCLRTMLSCGIFGRVQKRLPYAPALGSFGNGNRFQM